MAVLEESAEEKCNGSLFLASESFQGARAAVAGQQV
jgi:hypothetical protein